MEAWFEDFSAGPVKSISFSNQHNPYEANEAGAPGLKFWCSDFLISTSNAFIIGTVPAESVPTLMYSQELRVRCLMKFSWRREEEQF